MGLAAAAGDFQDLLEVSYCGLRVMVTGPCLNHSTQLKLGQLPLDTLGVEMHFAWRALSLIHYCSQGVTHLSSRDVISCSLLSHLMEYWLQICHL